MGDAVVSLWIAEGVKRHLRDSHEVKYLHSYLDPLISCFGFDIVEGEYGIRFGGNSKSYSHELHSDDPRPDRAILWQLECPFRVVPERPNVDIPAPSREWALDVIERKGVEKPLVLLFPFAAYGTRCWPVQKFIRLAWALEEAGFNTVALHTRKDGLEKFPFYMFGFSLPQVMALMRVADLVVANDSGSAHLAGTLGTHVLAMMGPTDPQIVFGYCPEIEPVSVGHGIVPCVGCHFKAAKGFKSACDAGCDALAMLDWRFVLERVKTQLFSKGSARRLITTGA